MVSQPREIGVAAASSFFFYTPRRPGWALAEVATQWLSVLAFGVFQAPVRRLAAFCLAPYLVWVTFAAYLNCRVVKLNAPFGRAS